MAGRGRTIVTILTALALAGACSGGDNGDDSAAVTSTTAGDTEVATGRYQATIRRTTDGVPHILADDVPSVLFGQGYASAEDYPCTLPDQILKIKGERAKWEGPGEDGSNVDQDFAWRAIGIDRIAREEYASQSDEVKEALTAFAGGWSASLAATGADNVAGWCRGEPWLQPVTAEDVFAYGSSIAVTASSAQLTSFLGKAQPPGSEAGSGATSSTQALGPIGAPPVASNGWAVGQARSEAADGLLLANPHFPWEGELRFWEVQLTVPGELNVYGAQLVGLPFVGIGFTEGVAWTHTVSAGNRFTAYLLHLVPGDPTSYLYDGSPRAMTSHDETVEVLQPDGTTTSEQRTLWDSHYGPIIDFPGIGWSDSMVISFRDANIDDDELLEQYRRMDGAKSLDDLIAAQREFQGVPLFNTIAADRDGQVWYADTSATPNLSPEAIAAYEQAKVDDPITKVAADNGAVLLDGSNSLYEWVDEPGARDAGLVPFDRMPMTQRDDYVFNANDSFWLNNADDVLEGDYSPLHGAQRTPRSTRTRENAVVLADTNASGPSGSDGLFSLEELRDASLLNEAFTARELRADVVARCTGAEPVEVADLALDDGTVALPAEAVDIAPACAALATWDGIFDLDSRGALVWREFIARATDVVDAGDLWANPFDPADPVGTPSGLAAAPATGDDPVLVNLARAVQTLTKGGLAVDATLRDTQFADRGGTLIPIHGAGERAGLTNVTFYDDDLNSSSEPFPARGTTLTPFTALTADGYRVNFGTSFLMAVELGETGPKAYVILTYGETDDSSSPLYTQQTERFSNKDWRTVVFTEDEIAADPDFSTESVSGG